MNQTARVRLALLLAATIAAFAGTHSSIAESQGTDGVPSKSTPVTTDQPSERPRRGTYPFRGVVAKVEVEAGRIALQGRQQLRVILITDHTRFERMGKHAILADLRAGDTVRGSLRKNDDGREQAVLIRITPKDSDLEKESAGEEGKEVKPEDS